jgi:ATP-binding cassette subfamily B protein
MTKERNLPGPSAGFPGTHRHGMFMGQGGKANNTKETLKRLWHYLGGQKRQLAVVFIMVLTGTGLSLAGPYLIGRAVDTMVGKGNVDFAKLAAVVGVLMVVYAISALTVWIQTYMMIGISQNTVRNLRKDLFSKVQTLSLHFFDSRPHGELMSRLTNDVENINNVLTQSTTQLISSIISLIGSLGMMLWISPLLTLFILIFTLAGLFLSKRIARITKKYFSAQQKELGELNGYIEETISGQRVVKAYCREAEAISKFEIVNRRLNEAGIRAQILSGIIPPLMNCLGNISFVLGAAAGGLMAVKGTMTVGMIAGFLNYAKQFTRPINDIANQFNMVQSALAGAERVFEVMDQKPELDDVPDAAVMKNVSGEVVFKDVDFGYEKGVPVLKNVNLKAKPGQTIALVGPTGAGKTTIVNLLTRFYDIDRGAILVDGKDIRTVKKDSLRSSLGIVLQDCYLFSDTIRENIRYGRLDATDEEVVKAAQLANAHSFIQRLPDGYDTVLTENAGNLSQGQRQLLTIARAILSDPAILILDEATSNVDTRTEMHIQQAMQQLMKGRTSFVIAHRLSTIRNADQILVINGGEIIERGNHHELLNKRGFYHHLYNSQFRRQRAV